MKKLCIALGVTAMLVGCTNTNQTDSIPVVDASSPLSNKATSASPTKTAPTTAAKESEEAVAVPVPQGAHESIQVLPQTNNDAIPTSNDFSQPNNKQPQPVTGIPNNVNNIGNEPLDGAVLALLTTAEQQQQAGNLNEAAASVERAQRIAPSEPRVLYSLAVINLKQGNAATAEQVARRALSYTGDDQMELKANLWEIIAQARDQQGDQAGAEQARQQKKVRI